MKGALCRGSEKAHLQVTNITSIYTKLAKKVKMVIFFLTRPGELGMTHYALSTLR